MLLACAANELMPEVPICHFDEVDMAELRIARGYASMPAHALALLC